MLMFPAAGIFVFLGDVCSAGLVRAFLVMFAVLFWFGLTVANFFVLFIVSDLDLLAFAFA